MSHYSCPVCTGSTSVIETRISQKGLRRRRSCRGGHRFTTIELPHDTGKRVTGLINWLTKQHWFDEDLVDYTKDELKAILSGQLPENDDEPTIQGPTSSDCGHQGSAGAAAEEAGSTPDVHQGSTEAEPPQGPDA